MVAAIYLVHRDIGSAINLLSGGLPPLTLILQDKQEKKKEKSIYMSAGHIQGYIDFDVSEKDAQHPLLFNCTD